MNAADQRRLTPLLIVLTAGLAAGMLVLLAGAGTGVRWDPPRAVAALRAPTSPVSLPQALPLEEFAVVWTKPLFSPNRKPIAHVADGGSTLGDLTLTGVLLTPDLHMALLEDRKAEKQLRLREGQALPDGSVTLVEVRARSALFDSAAGRTELKLAAGAPIDTPTAGAGANGAGPVQSAGGGVGVGGALNAVPAPVMDARSASGSPNPPAVLQPNAATPPPTTDSPPPRSAMKRMRDEIKKRRAAHAAAENEGAR